MKISRKNFKRPIVSNLEKLDKLNARGKRKNAVTRKIKIQQQKGGLLEEYRIKKLEGEADEYSLKFSNLRLLKGNLFELLKKFHENFIRFKLEVSQYNGIKDGSPQKQILTKSIDALRNKICGLLKKDTTDEKTLKKFLDDCKKNGFTNLEDLYISLEGLYTKVISVGINKHDKYVIEDIKDGVEQIFYFEDDLLSFNTIVKRLFGFQIEDYTRETENRRPHLDGEIDTKITQYFDAYKSAMLKKFELQRQEINNRYCFSEECKEKRKAEHEALKKSISDFYRNNGIQNPQQTHNNKNSERKKMGDLLAKPKKYESITEKEHVIALLGEISGFFNKTLAKLQDKSTISDIEVKKLLLSELVDGNWNFHHEQRIKWFAAKFIKRPYQPYDDEDIFAKKFIEGFRLVTPLDISRPSLFKQELKEKHYPEIIQMFLLFTLLKKFIEEMHKYPGLHKQKKIPAFGNDADFNSFLEGKNKTYQFALKFYKTLELLESLLYTIKGKYQQLYRIMKEALTDKSLATESDTLFDSLMVNETTSTDENKRINMETGLVMPGNRTNRNKPFKLVQTDEGMFQNPLYQSIQKDPSIPV